MVPSLTRPDTGVWIVPVPWITPIEVLVKLAPDAWKTPLAWVSMLPLLVNALVTSNTPDCTSTLPLWSKFPVNTRMRSVASARFTLKAPLLAKVPELVML